MLENILIGLGTGIVSGALTSFFVSKWFQKRSDKKEKYVFLMELINKSLSIVSLSLEPIRLIGNNEKIKELHDLVFCIPYYPNEAQFDENEADFFLKYKSVTQKISDAARVYLSYTDLPETNPPIFSSEELAQQKTVFLSKLSGMKDEIIQLVKSAECLMNGFDLKTNKRMRQDSYIKIIYFIMSVCILKSTWDNTILVLFLAMILECLALVYVFVENGKKIKNQSIEDMYRKKDMGESLFNILSTIYLSVVFYMLNQEGTSVLVVVLASIMVFIVFVYINLVIYRLKVAIRKLEKT